MYEYKTERVDPSEQQAAINDNAIFGWELMSAQETYNESTEVVGVSSRTIPYGSFMQGLTGSTGRVETNVKTKTNVINYVTLQYRRDKDLPKNQKLSELEHKVWDNFPEKPEMPFPPVKPIKYTIISIVIMVLFTIAGITGIPDGIFAPLILMLIVDVILIVVMIVKWAKHKKNIGIYNSRMRIYNDKYKAYNDEVGRRADFWLEAENIYKGTY